jgi:serine/threonine protein kinase
MPELMKPRSASAGAPPPVGGRVGKYLLTGRLGRGGMGVVYEAHDTVLERRVALKVLTTTEAAGWRRCLREARAAARLNHPNVVALYEAEQRDGLCYLAMELVPGGSTQAVLQTRGTLAWPEATRAIADACRGLAAAHAAGLIHRDVKPANLMRAADGTVKLTDFGLARAAEQTGPSVVSSLRAGGTPQYMSPEQSRGESLDPRTDLYSLGATYYALLVGKPPYPGEAPLPLMYAHCSKPVPDPRAERPEVPDGCAAIVRRAMAKYPAQRYRSAVDMLADLEAVLRATGEMVPTGRPATQVGAPAGPPDFPPGGRRSWAQLALDCLVLGRRPLAALLRRLALPGDRKRPGGR